MSIEFLYITADAIGTETGGGSVTREESEALRKLASGNPKIIEVWSFPDAARPWGADEEAAALLLARPELKPTLAHFYSGTFSKAIQILQRRGCKITYTAAAHDVEISKREHKKLGLPFDYPHLTDPVLWGCYVRGYLLADLVICPSPLSAACMESYGCKNVDMIPHGVNLPSEIVPPPKRFSVAYLGQPGPDKGLVYLLQAWARLDYKDAMLTIAGRGTEHLLGMVREFGGGNIYLRGWIENPAEIYRGCSVYVQPSASEGFGLEVLEAMSHGRPTICSQGAGAEFLSLLTVPSCDALALAFAINNFRKTEKDWTGPARKTAEHYTWKDIHALYRRSWESVL